MVDYGFFYDIVELGNKIWRLNFNSKQIAVNAYECLIAFEESKARGNYHVAPLIQELLAMLDESGSGRCKNWAKEIRRELKLGV